MRVKAGEKVKSGEHIGTVGDTAGDNKPHLHFEVLKQGKTRNPAEFVTGI